LAKSLSGWFKNANVEFVENTVFNGSTAIDTVIFGITSTGKNGGKVAYARGRSMVVYARYKDSPMVGYRLGK
jgi:hypothetical protein